MVIYLHIDPELNMPIVDAGTKPYTIEHRWLSMSSMIVVHCYRAQFFRITSVRQRILCYLFLFQLIWSCILSGVCGIASVCVYIMHQAPTGTSKVTFSN